MAFEQATFKPYKLCDNREDVLKEWLLGKSVSEIIKIGGKETVSFIQDALVYKLVWAIEAVFNQSRHTKEFKDIQPKKITDIQSENSIFDDMLGF